MPKFQAIDPELPIAEHLRTPRPSGRVQCK
jgi:hypothetical protein